MRRVSIGSLAGVVVLAAVAVAGCEGDGSDGLNGYTPVGSEPVASDDEDEGHGEPVDSVVSAVAAQSVFSVDGAYKVSPLMEAAEGSTRIGFLIDVWLDQPDVTMLDVEARGINAKGQSSDWVPVDFTWSEHPYLVGRADFGMDVVQVQFRVLEEDLARIAHFTWSAIRPEPEGTDEDTAQISGALSSGLANIGVKSRAQWNAKASKGCSNNSSKYRAAVHHTVTPTTSGGSYEKLLRAIQTYHQDTRGWCDVGYHFLVTSDGSVWEGRPVNKRGAHVGGNNTGNIGVSFVGCFHTSGCGSVGGSMVPPSVMLQAAGNLIGYLAGNYGFAVNSSTVKGHKDHSGQSTTCPGDHLHAQLSTIRDIANGVGSTPEPEPEPEPVKPAEGRILGVLFDGSVTQSPSTPGNVRLTNGTASLDGGPAIPVAGSSALFVFDAEPGEHTVTATAPGFEPYTRTLDVVGGQDAWGSVGLVPKPKESTLIVSVVDLKSPSLDAISTAIVAVEGQNARQVTGAGSATFTMFATEVVVSVYAAGFQAVQNYTVSLTPGKVENLMVGLEPVLSDPAVTGDLKGVIWDKSITSGPADAGNKRIDSAIVTCGCGQARWVNANSAYWTFETAPGPWNVSATAPGYEPTSRVLDAASGKDTWGSIGMSPQ